ncbi:MAG: hypothetical protein AAF517_21965, partial [Planctomycetota bacterium]
MRDRHRILLLGAVILGCACTPAVERSDLEAFRDGGGRQGPVGESPSEGEAPVSVVDPIDFGEPLFGDLSLEDLMELVVDTGSGDLGGLSRVGV